MSEVAGLAGRWLAVGVAAVIASGCSRQKSSRQFTEWLNRNNAHHQVVTALESDSPDARRQAVNRLALTKDVTADWAFAALDTVARTDRNEHVRCAAVRAMKNYYDERPVATLLMILNQPRYKDQVRPTSESLRWDAIIVLHELRRRMLIPADREQEALDSLLTALRREKDRNIRLAAADALGWYSDRRALEALVEAMNSRDYGLARGCNQSLVRLTGVDHDCQADRWASWLGEADDPFALAGQAPEGWRSSSPSWWDRTIRSVRRVIVAWQGEAKEGS